ncbi:MAG: PIN domain-containing protein [Methanobrevibacter sp.]|nr:PIN domain-containing protein [Methanobrevibacter sp.]
MILLDTSYIVAFFAKVDKDHEKALEISEKINNEKLIITDAILIESINLLTKRLNRNTKRIFNIYKFLKHNIKIIYTNEELIERALQTVIKYKAKIGLADAINIEVMKDLNIYQIVSFDPDFSNKEGIVRIY